MPASNILLHLAPCDISVTFGSETHVVPAMSAHQWCKILLHDPFDPYNVYPTMAGVNAVIEVEDAISQGEVDAEDLARVALETVSIAGDRPWWVTLRMLATAGQTWDRIGAQLIKAGVDARHLPLAAWLDVVWLIMLDYVDPKKLVQFVAKIEKPPIGWDTTVIGDDDDAAFMAAMAGART